MPDVPLSPTPPPSQRDLIETLLAAVREQKVTIRTEGRQRLRVKLSEKGGLGPRTTDVRIKLR